MKLLQASTAAVEHRGGMRRTWPDPDSWEWTGREWVARFVEELYDRLEADPELRPMFSSDLTHERASQRCFFEQWLGGESLYQGASLVELHHHIHITPRAVGRWLKHAGEAITQAGATPDQRMRLLMKLGPMAKALKNEDQPADRLRCERQKPGKRAGEHAARGELSELLSLLAERPKLEGEPSVLLWAARKGRARVVEALLQRDWDPNLAARLGFGQVMMTPLCAALRFKHLEIATTLLGRGALVDVFTSAFLGLEDCLEKILTARPEVVSELDPAEDFRDLHALHYAVRGKSAGALSKLLQAGASVDPSSDKLLVWALELMPEQVPILLRAGADLGQVRPGDWMADESLLTALLDAGLDPRNWDSNWIEEYCTGHHGNKERPDMLSLLFELGVDPQTRRRGATALHYAAKAGFLEVIQLLRGQGLSVDAEDEKGMKPVDWLSKAGRRVDREAVRRALG